MGIPWAGISVVATVAAYALTYYPLAYWPGLYLVVNFALAWLAQFLVYALGSVFLWPKLLSPLRGLPEPKGGSWWNGQYARIAAEPTGIPMQDWYVVGNKVPKYFAGSSR